MKGFKSLKILEQGMEIVSTTHQLADKYTQTDMAGLINEINLLAISIPSSVAESSKEETTKNYKQGLKQALHSVRDIERKLKTIPYISPSVHPLHRLKDLVDTEHRLIKEELGISEVRTPNRPMKRSRLSVTNPSNLRPPMPRIKVSQGVQGELF